MNKVIVAVDLDGILCEEDNTFDFSHKSIQERAEWYINKKPIMENIAKVNKYYGDCKIIIYTARDEVHREMTKWWLDYNKVNYDVLEMSKLKFHAFIDDRATNNFKELDNLIESVKDRFRKYEASL